MGGHGRRRTDPLHRGVPLGGAGGDGALRRELGLLEGWGDYPRKHVEAEFHRVLRFEDEIRRARPRRVRRADVDHVRLDDREGGRECVDGRLMVVHVDPDGRPAPLPDAIRAALESSESGA